MGGQLPYDYRELAYDLYHAEDQLLEELVSLRAQRGMTQKQLADEMGVSQSYVSQIENGRKKLMTLLTDYALEVGARITYSVEPAELKPEGGRKYDTWKAAQQMQVTSEWSNGDITVGAINKVAFRCLVWVSGSGGGGAGRVVWGYGYHVVVHRRPATA